MHAVPLQSILHIPTTTVLKLNLEMTTIIIVFCLMQSTPFPKNQLLGIGVHVLSKEIWVDAFSLRRGLAVLYF